MAENIFADLDNQYFGEASVPENGGVFEDLNQQYLSNPISLDNYTVKERAADIGKAFLRLPEHLAGTVGKIIKFAADYEPGLEMGLTGLALSKWKENFQPAWSKQVEKANRDLIRTHGEKIADFWTKAANTGFEAPSEELQRARQQEWYKAPITRALTAVADSGGSFLVSATATILTKNPQIGMVMLGVMSTAETYDELTDAGVDREVAQNISILSGTFEALTEKIPFDAIMEKAGKGLLKKFLKTGTLESLQEFVQNTGENYFKHFGYEYVPGDPSSVPDALKIEWGELLNGWFESITAGFLMGGFGGLAAEVNQQVNAELSKGLRALSTPTLVKMQQLTGRVPTQEEIDSAKEVLEKGEDLKPVIGEDEEGNPILLEGDAAIIAANELGKESLNVGVKVSEETSKAIQEETVRREVSDRQEIPASPKKVTEEATKLLPSESTFEMKTEEAINRAVQNLEDSAINWTGLITETKKLRAFEWAKRFGNAEEMMKSATGQEAFIRAKSQLAGEVPIAQFELANPVSAEDLFLLRERIRTNKRLSLVEKINTEDALMRIFGGQAPAQFQIKLFERAFGKEFAQVTSQLERMSLTTKQKLWRTTLGIINIPHAMLASCDLSASGRQGLFAGVSHPFLLCGATVEGMKAFVSDRATDFIDMQIRTNKYFEAGQRDGLVIRDYGAASANKADRFQTEFLARPKKLEKMEGIERVIGEILYTIPTVVSASERAYVTTLNKLRMDLYAHYANKWEGTNRSASDYKALANLVNHATGESRNKFIENNAPLFNAAFFAPRWTLSRFELIGDLAFTTPEVRKIAAKMWTNYVIAGFSALSLLSLAGFDVEKDPRSSDFGKAKYGDTRFDFFGGYTQIARLTAQLLTGEKKTISTGKTKEQNRLYTVGRFLESKASPVAGLVVDLLRKETFLGEDVYTTDGAEVVDQIWNRTAPLFLQDVLDAKENMGLGFAVVSSPLPFFGVGMQTYPLRPSQELQMEKDFIAKETFGKEWDELGELAQRALYIYHPELEVKERQVDFERSNEKRLELDFSEQQQSGLDLKNALPKQVQDEMERLLVSPGGFSRRIGSSWYLNDKRYKEYQDQTAKALNNMLPKIINHYTWNKLNEQQQRELLEYVIKKTKETIRKQLIATSNIKDLISLKERR